MPPITFESAPIQSIGEGSDTLRVLIILGLATLFVAGFVRFFNETIRKDYNRNDYDEGEEE